MYTCVQTLSAKYLCISYEKQLASAITSALKVLCIGVSGACKMRIESDSNVVYFYLDDICGEIEVEEQDYAYLCALP